MAYLYKTFNQARTVLYVCLSCFLMALAMTPLVAVAQSGAYTVADIKVDVSADNAINARNQAFEKAQQDAITKLAGQFLTESELAAYKPPSAAVIGPMIQDFEVTAEKLSSKRYIGTYTFRFKARNTRRHFENFMVQSATADAPMGPSIDAASDTAGGGGEPAPRTAAAQPGRGQLLILPYVQVAQQTVLWSQHNAWMQAWRRAGSAGSMVLPVGDLSDIEDINDQAIGYDRARMARALGRYGAQEAVIVLAAPDPVVAAAASDNTPVHDGSVTISLFRTDRYDGPQQVNEIALPANPGDTRGKLMDRAVSLVQQTLQTDWKNTNFTPFNASASAPAASIGTASTIDVRVGFSNLQEWASTQRNLVRIPGVRDVILKSLSPREALVGIVYNGDPDTLRIALQQAGMGLSQPAAPTGYDAPAGYDLYPHQAAPADDGYPARAASAPPAGYAAPYSNTF